MKKLLMLFFIAPFIAYAQQGTNFEKNVSFEAAKAKAKAENKYLFIDTYTTWCGPCKMMDANTFTDPKIGEFMNKHFVNTKFQMDQTANDSEEIKKLYADAKKIDADYKIEAYPSYLIFSPDGELAHRFVGYYPPEDFINQLEASIDPNQQIVSLQRKMKQNELNQDQLKNLLKIAGQQMNKEIAVEVLDKLLPNYTEEQLFDKSILPSLFAFKGNAGEIGHTLLTQQSKKVDEVMGTGYAASQIAQMVLENDLYPTIQPDQPDKLDDFTKLAEAKIKEYSQYNIEKDVQLFQVQVYTHFKKWDDLGRVVNNLVTKYQDALNPSQTNQLAWTIFENVEDAQIVKSMLAPMKAAVEKTNEKDTALLDTYANLLHKSGQTDEAIQWQQKAVNLLSGDVKTQYEEVLAKMKKGEKTW
jgi:thioredoxin-related protein